MLLAMVESSVISIGSFDGVHLGHRAILDTASALARDRGAQVLAIAFDPHPAGAFDPAAAPLRLSLPEQKQSMLLAAGADRVVLLEPTQQVLSQTPEQFADWLCGEHRPIAVVEGEDFRFGKGRTGDMSTLKELGRSLGFEAVAAPTFHVTLADMMSVPVSSSLIRSLLDCGRVADAATCLGRLYGITGPVIVGEKRGRAIGVPTANLDPNALAGIVIPAEGVYAGVVEVPDGTMHPAAVSIGAKPTFSVAEAGIEAYLLDFDGDLYEKDITVRFARWLRDKQQFADTQELVRQIERDIKRVRQWADMGFLDADTADCRELAAGRGGTDG